MRNLSDIFLPVRGFACAWMTLRARHASPWLLASFRDFEPPEHVPRTSTSAHTCAAVYRRAPSVPRSREHEEGPAAGGEKKCHMCRKHTFIRSNINICIDMLALSSQRSRSQF